MYKFFIILLFLSSSKLLIAQEFSNKGKDFWLGYGFHCRMVNNNGFTDVANSQEMILYFTSDVNANVLVTIPNVGYTKNYTVTANTVTMSAPLPKTGSQDARISGYGIFNTGIHITSDRPIVAYAHLFNKNASGASILFPTNTLGTNYYSLGFTQTSNEPNSNAYFFVVATQDSTLIEVTPSQENLNQKKVGVPDTILLAKKGQIYSMMGTTNDDFTARQYNGVDLSGSKIRSISSASTGTCKPIAVFSGCGKIKIGGVDSSSSDNLFAQAFPSNAWGKKYLTVPTGNQPNNFYRVCVKDPDTEVKLNGQLLPKSTLINQFYYQFKNANDGGKPIPNLIESNQPILVAQYCTSQGEEGNPDTYGDPEMIFLSPVEQTINKITLFSASQYQIVESYINVIIPTQGVNSFKIDGRSPNLSNFKLHPANTQYSYAIFNVSSGVSHSLYADSGFNAIAYGFGSAESYGYNAGTNIVDLNPPIKIKNDYASSGVNYSATCTNTPFKMYVAVPYKIDSLMVDFGQNAYLVKGPNFYKHKPIGPFDGADSTYIFNDRVFNVYYIPHSYEISAIGNYPVKIFAHATSIISDGCSNNNEQIIEDNIEVNKQPIANFSVQSNGCINSTANFLDESNGFGRTFYKWFWDFGNGITSTQQNPITTLTSYNSQVKFRAITDYGCPTDTIQSIKVSNKPIPYFKDSLPLCIGSTIYFIDQSTLLPDSNNDSIVNWIWSFSAEAKPDTLLKKYPLTKVFLTEGNQYISLQLKTNTNCYSDVYIPTFSIKPTPKAAFAIPNVCLADGFAPFLDASSISDGTTASLTREWFFAEGSPTVTSDKSVKIIYPAPGKYTAKLIEKASSGCTNSLVKDFLVNASDPIAQFNVLNSLPICWPTPVSIQNKSTVSFGNITKVEVYWDFINQPLLKKVFDNPKPDTIFKHIYPDLKINNYQVYTIKMVAYSGGTCMDSYETIIQVYPQPKAKIFQSATEICAGKMVEFRDETDGLTSVPVKWKWDFSNNAGTFVTKNISNTFNDSGLMNLSFFVTNANGCNSDTIHPSIIVHPNPTVNLKEQISLILGNTVTLTPEIIVGTNLTFSWFPDIYLNDITQQNPFCTALEDISYRLTVTSTGGCTASDDQFVLVLKPPEIPNAFSPNGDGINDTWNIKYIERYPGASVDVFDRYGQLVFHSDNYTSGWDGKFNKKPLAFGTYYYVINPKNGVNTLSGSVTIIQ